MKNVGAENVTAEPVLTAEEFRTAVLKLALEQSFRYRTAATREAPFDITECEWRNIMYMGQPIASCRLYLDGSIEQREYDGKRTSLFFAIDKETNQAMVCSGSGFGHRGFMVEASGKKGIMWIS